MRLTAALSLLLLALPLAAACDGGEDCPNQPPTLGWRLSTPGGLEVRFNRSVGQSLEFSISNAVSDPEEDPLFFVWYREVPEADSGPVPEVGDVSMTLNPCEIFSLRNASRVNVTVVVSDAPIMFDKDAELFPVVNNGAPYVMRVWTVELLDECP
ncbi:MAG: hypothetical protein ABIK09_11570 [Pseudomonadota bacterium]